MIEIQTHSVSDEGRFYKRILVFEEVEVEYSDADYAQVIEIDLANRTKQHHLELKEDGAYLRVTEGNFDLGIEELVEENVFYVTICGTQYHYSDLNKISSALSEVFNNVEVEEDKPLYYHP